MLHEATEECLIYLLYNYLELIPTSQPRELELRVRIESLTSDGVVDDLNNCGTSVIASADACKIQKWRLR
jgi:hypothetical protein